MGVINDLGIVGIVDNTSPKFYCSTECECRLMLKLKNQITLVVWNGKARDLCS
jgi:hypothetical protein